MDQQQKKHGIARRAVVGVGKAWSYSIGLTSLTRELGRIGGNVAAVGGYVRRKLADGPHNYRNEKFEEVVERLGLDEAQLIRQARAFNKWTFWWLAALLLATLWLAGTVWSNAPVLHVILSVGIMLVAFAKGITWRFRFCQVRDTELYSFGPWFWSLGGKW